MTQEHADHVAEYVIVGAGSAGCVLASRLTENPAISVLLIEAGPRDRNPFIHMPRGIARLATDPDLMWHTPVAREDGSNEPEIWLRGKVMGGSSSVNGMVYFRGFPENYDELGLPGWAWADMGPVFRQMENHELGAAEWRGDSGPLHVSLHHNGDPLCEAVIEAMTKMGVTRTLDINAESGESVGYQPRTIWRGQRESAARAFIKPVRSRPNLRILTNTQALQVVFEGTRAVGVKVRDGAGTRIVRAGREVILSAGTLHSPKLLLQSGIGPARHLAAMGIAVVADAPQVGQNLIEQRILTPSYRVARGSQNDQLQGARLVGNVLQYGLFRSGIMTAAMFEVAALIKSRPDVPRPDGKISFGPYSTQRVNGKISAEKEPGASLLCCQIMPRSRGTLLLASPDPDAPPDIRPHYLKDEEDRRISIDMFRRMRSIFDQESLRGYGAMEVSPGQRVQSDDEIVAAYLELGVAGLHAVGTCRMGLDEASVVDTNLRVRGVEGLRVVDISVLPSLVSSNTNGPAMAVGWRAADLLRQGA